mmetsp:Transcript_867/g.1915  ORF Transcript_867/g.1915 Transcript_867/m.1915 type:complete len:95 (-) Transcript_867:157-441(-)
MIITSPFMLEITVRLMSSSTSQRRMELSNVLVLCVAAMKCKFDGVSVKSEEHCRKKQIRQNPFAILDSKCVKSDIYTIKYNCERFQNFSVRMSQ